MSRSVVLGPQIPWPEPWRQRVGNGVPEHRQRNPEKAAGVGEGAQALGGGVLGELCTPTVRVPCIVGPQQTSQSWPAFDKRRLPVPFCLRDSGKLAQFLGDIFLNREFIALYTQSLHG